MEGRGKSGSTAEGYMSGRGAMPGWKQPTHFQGKSLHFLFGDFGPML